MSLHRRFNREVSRASRFGRRRTRCLYHHRAGRRCIFKNNEDFDAKTNRRNERYEEEEEEERERERESDDRPIVLVARG